MGAEVKSMEIKKTQQSIATEQTLTSKKMRTFIADVKSEIQKTTWTSRAELITYTKIVVLMTLIFGMSIYVLDLMIQGVLASLSFILRWIGG